MVVRASSTSIPGCGAPLSHPLRLFPCSQQQSSPRVCSPNPTSQYLSAPADTVSQAGTGRAVSRTPVYVSLCPACTDLLLCSPLSPWSSPSVPADPGSERASPDAEISPLLQLPIGVQVPSRFYSSSFSLISFILPGYSGIFLVISGVQGPLLVFSWCSVRIIPFVDVFLMHLWGEMNSVCSYSSIILNPPSPTYFLRSFRIPSLCLSLAYKWKIIWP